MIKIKTDRGNQTSKVRGIKKDIDIARNARNKAFVRWHHYDMKIVRLKNKLKQSNKYNLIDENLIYNEVEEKVIMSDKNRNI